MTAIPLNGSPDLAAVFERRAKIWMGGFRPVPVYGPHASVSNAGKRPKGAAWQELARLTPPSAVVTFPELDACNTAILCDGLQALDMDIDDADKVSEIRDRAESILGFAPIRFRSNSPRILMLYRAKVGSPKTLVLSGLSGKIETLGKGRVFGADGIHPSGVPYEWTPNAPGEFHLEELVSVTEEQVTIFLKEVAPLIGADTQKMQSYEPHLASGLGPTAALEDVKAALESIPNDGPANWEFWNDKIGLATWHATMGHPQGYQAWLKWSAKHPSFNEIECKKRWANYGKSPPHEIGAGTLFYLAKQAKLDWCKPSSIPSPGLHKFGVPNMGVLTESNHLPPTLPISAFGNFWGPWIKTAAECANVPPDYVAVPLLATASAFIGNARWSRAWDGWQEPPVIWCGSVGEPSSGKTHGASIVMNLVDEIEANIGADYEDELLAWKEKATLAKQHEKLWKKKVDAALSEENTPPQKPKLAIIPERPARPRLSVIDTTIEQLATILSGMPKGLLIRRDELSGWLANFSRYSNGCDRPFWLEANGGGPYKVDRVRSEEPTLIRHLSLPVFGTIQPDRLAETLTGADDGLISRFLWTWPESKCFVMPDKGLPQEDAIAALLRLEQLDLVVGTTGQKQPKPVPLVHEARMQLQSFGQHMQEREKSEFGLMKSTLGKARGQALRLAIVLEYLWWSARPQAESEPAGISVEAMSMAIGLMDDYFLPMAARVFGDAAVPQERRAAKVLGHWILKTHPGKLNVSQVRDHAKLPGLRESKDIKAAFQYLEEANWLRAVHSTGLAGRPRGDYIVNPQLWAAKPSEEG